jgi:hypothetical protein
MAPPATSVVPWISVKVCQPVTALQPSTQATSARFVAATLARILRVMPRCGNRRSNRNTRLGPTSNIKRGFR